MSCSTCNKWDTCDKESYSVYKFDDEWIEI